MHVKPGTIQPKTAINGDDTIVIESEDKYVRVEVFLVGPEVQKRGQMSTATWTQVPADGLCESQGTTICCCIIHCRVSERRMKHLSSSNMSLVDGHYRQLKKIDVFSLTISVLESLPTPSDKT